jgi:hypothetical protein
MSKQGRGTLRECVLTPLQRKYPLQMLLARTEEPAARRFDLVELAQQVGVSQAALRKARQRFMRARAHHESAHSATREACFFCDARQLVRDWQGGDGQGTALVTPAS